MVHGRLWSVDDNNNTKLKENTPPQLFLRFFRWFCHPELLKYIEGDLMELYDERLKILGKRKADIKFIVDVLLLFRRALSDLDKSTIL